MTLILTSDSYDSLYFCHVKKFDGTTLKTIYDMAKTTKRQIAATAMAIAIVGGGGVVYAGNAPDKDTDPTNHNMTSAPITERR